MLYVSSLVTILVNFLLLPILTQYLSVVDYGAFALYFGWFNFCQPSHTGPGKSIDFGLNTVGKNLSLFFKHFYLPNITLILFWPSDFYFSDFLTNFAFNGALHEKYVGVALINGAFQYFFINLGNLLNAQNRSNEFVFGSIMHVVINYGLLLILVLNTSKTFEAMVIAMMMANVICSIFFILINRNLFVLILNTSHVKTALKFCYPDVPTLLVGLLLER